MALEKISGDKISIVVAVYPEHFKYLPGLLDNLEKQLPKLNPKKVKRNVNDMSFNYAQTDFKFEEQSNA